MQDSSGLAYLAAVLSVVFLSSFSSAQQPLPTAKMPGEPANGRFAIGAKVGILGPGVEFGARVSPRVNVRAGVNFFNYDISDSRQDVSYSGQIRLHSLEGHVDFFPKGGNFHVSFGVVGYMSQPFMAEFVALPGHTITLGNTDFISAANDPMRGNATLGFNRVAPTITVGYGNLVPRKAGKHWSFPVEIGTALSGRPDVNIKLHGTLCDFHGTCYNAATDPNVQGPLQQEEKKRSDNISWLRFFPLFSAGVAYRF